MHNTDESIPSIEAEETHPETESDTAAPENISFENLIDSSSKSGSEILAALNKLGIITPTPIQATSLKPALEGKDLVLEAATGSGKTLAFVLPMLLNPERDYSQQVTQALIVTPTRELAQQITDVIQSLLPESNPVILIGGESLEDQTKLLNKNPQIVIGTPGRLLETLRKKILKLRDCRYFALDEADEMLSMGFIDDVRAILSRLPDKRQGMFVSATITPRVDMLASSFLTTPKLIAVAKKDDQVPNIEHFFCELGGDLLDKPHALCDIIETERPRSAVIFCNTKSDTSLVEALLARRGFAARRINSDLSQKQRGKVMEKIRSGELPILVATDIAARGIDNRTN